jgi:hypothetical protein
LQINFPKSAKSILDVLFDDEKMSNMGAFENTAVYGQPNPWWGFVPKHPTKLDDPTHRSFIEERLNLFFGDTFQQRWLDFLGDSAHTDPTLPEATPQIDYEDSLRFWKRLAYTFNIQGLGKGLIPFQISNTLVELGLLKSPSLSVIAEVVAQNPTLGASNALQTMGFDFKGDPKNPAMAALAFDISYHHVQSILSTRDPILRFTPVDHEHMLCKVSRLLFRLSQAYKGGTHLTRLQTWMDAWLPRSDGDNIGQWRLAEAIQRVNGKCYLEIVGMYN